MTEGDVGFPVHSEVVEKSSHPIIEPDPAVTDAQHHRRRRRERFGERCDVEDRVLTHRRTVTVLERPPTCSPREGDAATDVHEHDHAGKHSPLHRRVHGLLDPTEVHGASAST